MNIFKTSSQTRFNRLQYLLGVNLVVCALILSFLLVQQKIIISNSWLAMTITASLVIFLPGFLLSSVLFPRGELAFLEKITMSGILGLSLLIVLGAVHLFAHTELSQIGRSLIFVELILAILFVYSKNKFNKSFTGLNLRIGSLNMMTVSLIAILAVSLLILFTFFFKTNTMWRWGDNWTYISVLRDFLSAPQLMISDIYVGVNPIGARLLFVPWLVVLAFLCQVSSIAPSDMIFTYIQPLLMILSLLGLYSLTRALCKNTNVAILAVVIQIIYYLSDIGEETDKLGVTGFMFIGRLGEDKGIMAFVLVPFAIFAAVRFLASGHLGYIIAFFILANGVAWAHPQGIILLGLGCGLYIVVSLFFRRDKAYFFRSAIVLMVIAICCYVLLAQVLFQFNRGISMSYYNELQYMSNLADLIESGFLSVYSAEKGIYMLGLNVIRHPFITLAILLALVMLLKIRRDIAVQFIFSNLILLLFILYNPLTAPVLGRVTTPTLLWRVTWLLPIGLSIAYAYYLGITNLGIIQRRLFGTLPFRILKPGHRSAKLSASAGAISGALIPWVLILILSFSQHNRISQGVRVFEKMEKESVTLQERTFLDRAGSLIRAGSYVLADPSINTLVPAFMDARVFYFRTMKPYHLDSIRDVREFHRSKTVDEELIRILCKYDVTKYVILDQEASRSLIAQFDRMPLVFTEVYQEEAFVLYELRPDLSTEAGKEIVWGSFYNLQGDHQQALQVFSEAVAHEPDSSLAYVGLGDAYLAQKLSEKAIDAYQKALDLDATLSLAYIALGNAYWQNGDLENATASYKQVPASDPYSTIAGVRRLQVLGDWEQQQGHTQQAIEFYRGAIQYGSSDAFAEQTNTGVYRSIALLDREALVIGNPLEAKLFITDDSRHVVLFQHPPSQARFRLDVPASARLRFGIALSAEVWQLGKGDGVQFDIYLNDGHSDMHLFSEYIDPKNVPADRRWYDYELDISSWAGQTVTLTLVTDPGPNSDDRYDWAGWDEPRIVQPVWYDFLNHLPEAEQYNSKLSQTRVASQTIHYDTRPIMFQHPISRITFTLSLPPQSALYFGLGMDPMVWSPDMGDGIEYNIYVREEDSPYLLHRIFHRYIDPKNNLDDRRWFNERVDLSRFGGREIDIVFESLAGPDGDPRYDWGGWSNPVLVNETVLEETVVNLTSASLREGWGDPRLLAR